MEHDQEFEDHVFRQGDLGAAVHGPLQALRGQKQRVTAENVDQAEITLGIAETAVFGRLLEQLLDLLRLVSEIFVGVVTHRFSQA